jgi:hypothetical protein
MMLCVTTMQKEREINESMDQNRLRTTHIVRRCYRLCSSSGGSVDHSVTISAAIMELEAIDREQVSGVVGWEVTAGRVQEVCEGLLLLIQEMRRNHGDL